MKSSVTVFKNPALVLPHLEIFGLNQIWAQKVFETANKNHEVWAGTRAEIEEVGISIPIEYDRSPVLEESSAYLAKSDHREMRIELNEKWISRQKDPSFAESFLVFHEWVHFWAHGNRKWQEFGTTEEEAADALAFYALQTGFSWKTNKG